MQRAGTGPQASSGIDCAELGCRGGKAGQCGGAGREPGVRGRMRNPNPSSQGWESGGCWEEGEGESGVGEGEEESGGGGCSGEGAVGSGTVFSLCLAQ